MGKIVGFDISSQEPEKAAIFYSEVFGWETEEAHWGYRPVKPESCSEEWKLHGGISKGTADFPHGTRIQIQVDSIENTLEKAKAAGALVVRERMDFDDFSLAYLTDPTGVGLGLIEYRTGV
ncbi:hypothetical protein CR205_02875 [Alteribacter lacisalsi]|uniref:VOC domain-containing protein n=1 Tax=Alteribacter lacisalsi TaxID=2045244 RepID=A0A2W0H9U6_9BACI|nr:VOC family protein [Alteribacter lacisalsi]PYZ97556.1 hypothetical protein CR205_02875 [Alteribacter lacisalsi]